MDKKHPNLAILVGSALAKNGMKSKKSEEEDDLDLEEGYKSDDEADEQLQEISDELVAAIHDKDGVAVKDLLREAFECMEMSSHRE